MPVPQTLIHDICRQRGDMYYPVGNLIIRSVLHDLIDRQEEEEKNSNIHKVLITAFHSFSVATSRIHWSETRLDSIVSLLHNET